jgi:hypothetical protein
MMDTMEILGVDPEDEVEAESKSQPEVSTISSSAVPRKTQFQAITAGPDTSSAVSTSEKSHKKRKGLTAEQKERLELMQKEQEIKRKERVSVLSKKLLDKISVWAETDRSKAVTEAFKTKIQVAITLLTKKLTLKYEAEVLKLESFGVDLLHTIGLIYTQKATTCLKSSRYLGLGGVWFRTKERGTLVKSAWGTMASAVEASIAGRP